VKALMKVTILEQLNQIMGIK